MERFEKKDVDAIPKSEPLFLPAEMLAFKVRIDKALFRLVSAK